MRINIHPPEIRGTGVESVVLPLDIFDGNQGTRVDPSLKLLNQRGLLWVLSYALGHIEEVRA